MAQIGNLGSLRVGIELPIKDWNKNYKKVTEDVKKYPKTTDKALKRAGKAWEKHAGTIKAASIGMIAFGTAAAVGFGMAVNEAATFQQSMVNTQAVAGATAEELKQLTRFAREMGKQTVFSAKESADAMVSLASAGQNTNEIMNSLKGTLNLAAATNSDLAFTSRTVASTLSQFGFAATESDRIANVFTATISASQATMDKLATSMSIVGPVAKAVGLSLEETAGILGGLFNAGLDASTAGTSLRQSLAQLLKPTDDAKEALGRLNVETLDSQGKLRNLTDIIADLEKSGLSAADALAIFGVRAGPGMLALVSQGADSIRDLTEAITGTDKAAEIAALMVETFEGQKKLLKSAVSELKITIGNELLPILTEYTTKLAGIINKTSDWAAENPKLTKTLVKLGVAVSVITIGLGGIGLVGPGIARLGKVIKPVAGFVALFGSAAAGAGVKFTALGAAVTGVGVAAVTAGAAWWAYRRIQAAANKESDLAAISAKILKERQEDLLLALEQIGGALNVFEQTGNRVDATLQDLGIDAAKLTSVLGGNFTATNNASRVFAGLSRNFEKTTKKTAELIGTIEKLGPTEEDAATKTKRLATEMIGLEKEVKNLSQTLLSLPSAVEMGTTQLQRQADKAVAILKQRTTFEKDWITTNGIIQLGLVEKNVDERLKLIGDETKEERRIRIKAQKEDRKDREKGLTGALFIPETEAKKVIKSRKKIASESMKVAKDGSLELGKIESVVTKREFKDAQELADDKLRIGAGVNDRIAANNETARKDNLEKAKKNMQEWQNSWGAVIGDVEGNFASLYDTIIDPSLEVGWKKFFGRFKDIAIQTASDILADRTIKQLMGFLGLTGRTTIAKTSIPAPDKALLSGATDTVAQSSNVVAAASGVIASAASIIAPLAAAAFVAGGIGLIAGGGGTREAKVKEGRVTLDPAVERALRFTQGDAAVDRFKKNLGAQVEANIRFVENIPQRRQQRLMQAEIANGVAGESFQPFVPRRPEGTDRFGRPLAATTAMTPARGGNVTFGDINIILPDITDIRDLDSAEWERILRDNIQPAAEAIGLRFVRSDNLMTG